MIEKEQSVVIPNGTAISDETRRAAWREARWSQRFRSLPQDAELIAEKHANKLATPLLKEPLTEFLSASASIPGIDGIALVEWHDIDINSTFLSVYALIDLKDLGKPEPESSCRKAASAIGELYYKLDHAVKRISNDSFRTELGFIHTKGKNANRVFRGLKRDLMRVDLIGGCAPDEYPAIYTFARTK